MKRIWLFLFPFCCVYGHSQILSDTVIQVVPYYHVGDTYNYQAWNADYSVEGRDTLLLREMKTLYEIQVIETTETQTLLRATMLGYEVNEPDPTRKKIMETSYELAKDISIDYLVNDLGVYQGIVNWEDIQKLVFINLDKVFDVIFSSTPGINDLLDMDTFKNSMKQSFSTRESIQNNMGSAFSILYMYHGGQYEINTPYEHTIEINNVMSGKSFPAKGVFWIDVVYPEDSVVEMIMTASLDGEEFMASVMEWTLNLLKNSPAFAGNTEEITPEMLKEHIPSYEVNQSYFHIIDVEDGWTIHFQLWQENIINGNTGIKVSEFTIVE